MHGESWDLFGSVAAGQTLIRGDAAGIRNLSLALTVSDGMTHGLAGQIGAAAAETGAGFIVRGSFADAFSSALATLPPPTLGLSDAAGDAATILSAWATEVADADADAQVLLARTRTAHEALHAAEDALDHAERLAETAAAAHTRAYSTMRFGDEATPAQQGADRLLAQRNAARQAARVALSDAEVTFEALRAEGDALREVHDQRARAVAEELTASTPSLQVRVPFAGSGPLPPSNPGQAFVEAIADTFVDRFLGRLDETDPDTRQRIEELVEESVVMAWVPVEVEPAPRSASDVGDSFAAGTGAVAWVLLGASFVVVVVVSAATGGLAVPPLATGLVTASGAIGATGGTVQAVGGLIDGDVVSVAEGVVTIVTSQGRIVRVPQHALEDLTKATLESMVGTGVNHTIPDTQLRPPPQPQPDLVGPSTASLASDGLVQLDDLPPVHLPSPGYRPPPSPTNLLAPFLPAAGTSAFRWTPAEGSSTRRTGHRDQTVMAAGPAAPGLLRHPDTGRPLPTIRDRSAIR